MSLMIKILEKTPNITNSMIIDMWKSEGPYEIKLLNSSL